MPPYHLKQKFDFYDDIIIVSKTTLRIINYVLQDMGACNISQKMLKNPLVDKKKTKIVFRNAHMQRT
jgi:hypothetical protein